MERARELGAMAASCDRFRVRLEEAASAFVHSMAADKRGTVVLEVAR